jgi:hypothetical protein
LCFSYDGLFCCTYELDESEKPVSNDWINVTFSRYVNFKLDEMKFEIPSEADTVEQRPRGTSVPLFRRIKLRLIFSE